MTASIAYASILLSWGGATFHRLYSPSPYHRLQAEALLKGHLYFSDSISDIQQNIVLFRGKLQQVWGLGVGMWLAPFELTYHLFGYTEFPDRIPMGIAFSALGFYALHKTADISKTRGRTTAFGFCLLTLFPPIVLTFTNGRHLVYEDTMLYASAISTAVFCATVSFASQNRLKDFYICSTLAAFSGLVRPTHAVYGLAGVLTCSLVLHLQHRRVKHILFGLSIFLAGLLFLATTNYIRFGSPFEFGHTLTVTNGPMVYCTRFNNPFRSASILEANEELFGALFFSSPRTNGLDSEEMSNGLDNYNVLHSRVFTWQSRRPRWRDMYTTAFDWSSLTLLVTGVFIGFFGVYKAYPSLNVLLAHRLHLELSLFIWFLLTVPTLWCFYLYFPTLSSRYLLDFAPGFTCIFLLVWLISAKRAPTVALFTLVCWLAFEAVSVKSGASKFPLLTRQEVLTHRMPAISINSNRGSYSIDEHPITSRIPFNGEGWNNLTGEIGATVLLVVDSPRFVELNISPLLGNRGSNVFRARIANRELPLQSIRTNAHSLTVAFREPEDFSHDTQVLFLSFVDAKTEEDFNRSQILNYVRWQ